MQLTEAPNYGTVTFSKVADQWEIIYTQTAASAYDAFTITTYTTFSPISFSCSTEHNYAVQTLSGIQSTNNTAPPINYLIHQNASETIELQAALLEVYDAHGRKIINTTNARQGVALGQLAIGTYMYTTTEGDKVSHGKIIIIP